MFLSHLFLNFLWEISQSFLYAPHYAGTAGLIKVHLWASMGDVLLVFIILSLDYLIFSRILSDKKRFLAVIFTGFVVAALVEKYALATGRWSYDSLMPIIPLLKVGLTPILQMMIIPPIVIAFWLRWRKK